jgi:membrane associated rhomboid family serine protease
MKRQIIVGPNTPIVRLGGRPPRVVQWLLVEQVGLFLAYAFADGPAWVRQLLAASGGGTLARLQVYQPLTALWIHLGTQALLFNALVLWLFGSALERWWGGRRFLTFWIVTGVVGLCVGVPFGLLAPERALAGSAGARMAMLLATARIFPRHLVSLYRLLPFKAGVACLLLGAILLLGDLMSGRYLELAVQLGGAAVALLFLFPPGRQLGQWRVRRAKRKFGVLEGGRGKKGKRYLN